MADLLKGVDDKVKMLIGNWTVVTALGSIVLYLMGYLTLRFYLTVLGIGTDLSVLDERYIFEGVRFFIYLVSSVPIIAMLLLILVVIFYVPWRVLTIAVAQLPDAFRHKIGTFLSASNNLALTGIIISVAIIQLIMRQALLFVNLLLAKNLPDPEWLQYLLLTENEGHRQLFFCALLAGVMISAGFLLSALSKKEKTSSSDVLTGVLGVLISVQLLFIPINYGTIISSKTMPSVRVISGSQNVAEEREAWLIWEGREGITFLVRNGQQLEISRSLVTIPRNDVKRIEITGYDNIMRKLFLMRKIQGDEGSQRSAEK